MSTYDLSPAKRLISRLLRVLVLLVLAGMVLLWLDPANLAVIQTACVAVFLSGVSHVIRLLLFPHIDLQAVALQAVNGNNIGAGIVFSAIVCLLVVIILIPALLLR